MEKITSPAIEKLTEMMILIALLEKEEHGEEYCTNTDLSEYLGIELNSPKCQSSISTYLGRLEDAKHISIKKGSFLDQRKNKLKLTVIGKAQAHLARLSLRTVEGKDEFAGEIIKFGERVWNLFKARDKNAT